MIFKKNIIEKISEQLLLPFSGIEQDWDLEMANAERIDDFITFYEFNNLDFDEKKSVLALIIASYNDFLNENIVDDRWLNIIEILKMESEIFKELYYHWSVDGLPEDLHPISILMKKV